MKFHTPARVSVIALLVLLSACGDRGVTVTTQFTNTQDIQDGSIVYFDGQPVGEVAGVDDHENGLMVELSIDKEAAKSINSRAAVVVNRLKEGAPLEIYNREGLGNSDQNEMLQDGQTIKGLDSMFQLGAWMVGDAIKLGAGSLSQYVESFQEYLGSDKFEEDKQVVRQQIDSAKSSAQQVIKQVETDLQSATEAINQELTVSEQEAAQAMEQLGEELAPVVEELASTGSELMREIERLTEGLAEAQGDERKTGEEFLASLLATMEKLNQSMEQGAQDDTEKAVEGAEQP